MTFPASLTGLFLLLGATSSLAGVDAPSLASKPSAPPKRLDLGGGASFHPAALLDTGLGVSVTTDLRFSQLLSAGLSLEDAGWGPRLMGHGRLYPLSIARSGLFVEGGVGADLGGARYFRRETFPGPSAAQQARGIVTASLGYRAQGPLGWAALKAGWSFPVTDSRYSVQDGALAASERESLQRASAPGPMVSFAVGPSFF